MIPDSQQRYFSLASVIEAAASSLYVLQSPWSSSVEWDEVGYGEAWVVSWDGVTGNLVIDRARGLSELRIIAVKEMSKRQQCHCGRS